MPTTSSRRVTRRLLRGPRPGRARGDRLPGRHRHPPPLEHAERPHARPADHRAGARRQPQPRRQLAQPGKAPQTGPAFNADGWRSTPTKPDPETEAEIAGRRGPVPAGQARRGRGGVRRSSRRRRQGVDPTDDEGVEAKDSKNLWSKVKGGRRSPARSDPADVGREGPLLPGRIPVSARQVRRRQRDLREAPERVPRQPPPGEGRRPRVRHRPGLVRRRRGASTPADAAAKDEPTRKSDGKDAAVRQAAWTDHFNGRLPLIDVDGYALKAMEHVRQHDPTGPLADVATLRHRRPLLRRGRLRERLGLLRPAHQGLPQEQARSSRPSSARSTPR